MNRVEVEFRMGGDGESEQLMLTEQEFERVFGSAELARWKRDHPDGELSMDEGGNLRRTRDVPIAFSQLLSVISDAPDGKPVRIRIEALDPRV